MEKNNLTISRITIWCTITLILNSTSIAAQSELYRWKGSNKFLTKAQYDSILLVNKAIISTTKFEGGKKIIEVDDTDAKSSQQIIYRDTASREPKTPNQSISINKTYKDENGNPIEFEDFRQKVRSGIYGARYEANQIDGQYNVTYFLTRQKDLDASTEIVGKTMTQELKGKKLDLPEFRTIDNNVISSSDMKGKVVVFNFWFIGCRPCIQEMPLLNQLRKDYAQDSEILFLAPALDDQESLRKFLAKKEFDYTVIPDSKTLTQTFGIEGYPTHIVIDRNGVVVEVVLGALKDIDKKLQLAINNIKSPH